MLSMDASISPSVSLPGVDDGWSSKMTTIDPEITKVNSISNKFLFLVVPDYPRYSW